MEQSYLKKISYGVNCVILFLVFGHMLFFNYIGVPFLVAFSIPDVCIYLIGFLLIYLDKLHIYVWMIFGWITLYSGVTTVCIGSGFGFHLYCFAMIPILFVTEYISKIVRKRSMKAMPISIAIAVFYIIFTGYTVSHGPLFECTQRNKTIIWTFNAFIVLCFLISFVNYLLKLIYISEDKLKKAAQIDQLTKLYNRHYMFDILTNITKEDKECVLAIADIDNFKRINDTYGHNAGDEVLRNLSERISRECPDCELSRWGGEEFLIISYVPYSETIETLDNLRKNVEATPVDYEGQKISVTITIGLASRSSGQNPNEWIQIADSRLYSGKNSGKNCIVTNAGISA